MHLRLRILCDAALSTHAQAPRSTRPTPACLRHVQDVYVQEMTLYSTVPPLQLKNGRAPGKWFEARTVALKQLSIKHYGLKVGALEQEPAQLFKLMERPPHSNFPDCTTCKNNTKHRMQCIVDRLPRATRDLWVARQTKHIADVYAERAVLATLRRESTRKGG